MRAIWQSALVVLCATALFEDVAHATVDLRVESSPATDPIDAFVRVTDAGGPVSGLDANDFAVLLDGAPVGTFSFVLPPAQNPAQKVSVVIAIDADPENGFDVDSLVQALSDFIGGMALGDYAAMIQFRVSVLEPGLGPYDLPFTLIDGAAGTSALLDFLVSPYRGGLIGQNDAMILGVEMFAAPPVALPDGPKAVVLVGDAAELPSLQSQSSAVALASSIGIPIFAVRYGNIGSFSRNIAMFSAMSSATGGTYLEAPTGVDAAEALATVASLLNNGYRLTIPQTAVTDCNPHMLEVTVQGQTQSAAFNRCDTTPEPFEFETAENVPAGSVVVSNAAVISGIEGPVDVTVTGGEYSVGCNGTFVSTPGIAQPDAEVCVRHTTSGGAGAIDETLLIAGGVSAIFLSTVAATPPPPPPPPPPGNDGGGGSTRVPEVLMLLGLLFATRRRLAL